MGSVSGLYLDDQKGLEVEAYWVQVDRLVIMIVKSSKAREIKSAPSSQRRADSQRLGPETYESLLGVTTLDDGAISATME